MTTVTQLLERNSALATGHQVLPLISENIANGVDLPHTLVVTCADPRCSPERFLGLQPTDGVVVIRNAGGHVTHEIESILALDHLLGVTDILVIHHTDCGTLIYTDEGIKEDLKKRMSTDFSSQIDAMAGFGGITDVEQSVHDDIAILRASPYIRKALGEHITGYVFDIKTGVLTKVSPK